MTAAIAAVLLLSFAPSASAQFGLLNVQPQDAHTPAPLTTGGRFSNQIAGAAVNFTGAGGVNAGDVYFADIGAHRIQRFNADGQFIEGFGWDVNESGARNKSAIQSLTVKASGGQFKLTFGASTTGDLAFNATASQVQAALEGLPTIGAGNVVVTGGPGDLTGTVPYGIFFTGTLKESAQSAITTSSGTTPLSGGAASATIFTINGGGGVGFEVCKASETCKSGITNGLGGGMNEPYAVGIDAGNGNLYVPERGSNRVSEYTASGIFVRAFGKDVVATGKPENQVATTAKQTLTVKATSGAFTLEFEGQKTGDLAFNASAAAVQAALQGLSTIGNGDATVTGGPGDEGGTKPYVITFAGALKETAIPLIVAANGSTPLAGGEGLATVVSTTAGSNDSEICINPANCQTGAVGALGGAFAKFPETASGGAGGGDNGSGIGAGAGAVVAPSTAPNAGNVLVTDPGNLRVQEFSAEGKFIRAFGADVVNFGPDNGGAANEQQTLAVRGTGGTYTLKFGAGTTPALSWTASPAEIEKALNELSTIGAIGGSVTVTGGPGNAEGTSPYSVTFGGSLRGTNVAAMTIGTNSLTGGSPTSGVTIATLQDGAAGFEVCKASAFDVCKAGVTGNANGQFATATPTRIAEDSTGAIYTVEPTTNFRVQKFTLPGNAVTPFGPFDPADLTGTASLYNGPIPANNPSDVTVGSGDHVYVLKRVPADGVTECVYGPIRNETRIVELAASGTLLGERLKCAGFNVGSNDGTQEARSFSFAINPVSGRFYFTDARNTRGFLVLGDVPGLTASVDEVAGVAGSTATLKGTVTPGQTLNLGFLPTKYHFQVREVGDTVWRSAPAQLKVDPNLGNGSGSGSPASCPAGNPPSCAVSQQFTGLRPESEYETRIAAYVEERFNDVERVGESVFAPALLVNGPKFQTLPAPPVPHASRAYWSSPADTGPSLTFEGSLNPSGTRTTYHFEFVSQEDFEASGWQGAERAPLAPAPDAEAGKGIVDTLVKETLNGFDPTKSYHFRLVASNKNGSSTSNELTVSPPSPTARYFELVSNADSEGMPLVMARVRPDGERASMTGEALGEPEALPATAALTEFLSKRTPSGWSVYNLFDEPAGNEIRNAVSDTISADFTTALSKTVSYAESGGGEITYRFVSDDGSRVDASPLLKSVIPLTGAFTSPFALNGASSDLDTYVVTLPREVTLLPGEVVNGTGAQGQTGNLFEVVHAHASPTLHRVNETTAGVKIGGECSATFGSRRGISYDGSVIFFSARPAGTTGGNCSANPLRVFKRVNASVTTEISASECNRIASLPAVPACETLAPGGGAIAGGEDTYRTATFDGSKAFFTSPRQLTNGDTDGTEDLYMYDSQARNEVQQLTVTATSGSYSLTALTGQGTGVVSNGSKLVTEVKTASGSFRVGDAISGFGIPSSTSIVAVGAGTLELSSNATAGGTVSLAAAETTGAIEFNAPASGAGSVQEKLNGLAAFGPGAVTVSGGGANPYLIEFSGAGVAGTPQAPLGVNAGGLVGTATEAPSVYGGHLIQVSAGEPVAVDHPTVGNGAEVQGVVDAAVDGSRVYFVAKGRLTAAATKGALNLYVYERDASFPSGRIHYIATVGPEASGMWAGQNFGSASGAAFPARDEAGELGKGNGRYLLFSVKDKLLPIDTDSQEDLYRYDDEAASNKLTCVSCQGNGELPVTMPRFLSGSAPTEWQGAPPVITDDGSKIVFATKEALVPSDQNIVSDLYLWDEGTLELVTRGDWKEGIETLSTAVTGNFAISPSGRDIFLSTPAPLVPSDNDSAFDTYDARVGGGFPAPSGASATCQSGVECHGGGEKALAQSAPGSATFGGPGNPAVAAPTCSKGKVRRHGRCVKKHSKHHKRRHAPRANKTDGGVK